MKLCTACRVRPATNRVGSWPVCGRCGGRTANHVLGITPGKEIVGQAGMASNLLQLGLAGLFLGLGLVIGMNFMERH